jgi:hypothetical protein
VSNFTLDVAQQIANAATGQRKKLPFATAEELLSVLQEAEAAHDEAVSDFEDVTEDSRQRQILLDFAPAARRLHKLWKDLAKPGRRTILSVGFDACLEDEVVRRRLEHSDKDFLEKQLLLEFLPAFAEASLSPSVRRAKAAGSEAPADKVSPGPICLDELQEVPAGRRIRQTQRVPPWGLR